MREDNGEAGREKTGGEERVVLIGSRGTRKRGVTKQITNPMERTPKPIVD